ncbi:MAG: hypothetical protein AMXMBFR13_46830 [Phycisphaerae bacterium]
MGARERAELSLPPEACCWTCGYNLRGLRDARCPECGRPFTAEQFAAVDARWPGMLAWVLTAIFLPAVLIGPAVWPQLHWSIQSGGFLGHYLASTFLLPGWDWWIKAYVAHGLLAVSLGLPAIVGLVRRRDWGRRLALAALSGVALICFLMAVVALADVPMLRAQVAGDAQAAATYSAGVQATCTEWVQNAFPQMLLCIALVWFLLTGQRPQALPRRANRRSQDKPAAEQEREVLLVILLSWVVLIEAGFAFQQIVGLVVNPQLFAFAAHPRTWVTHSALRQLGGLIALGTVIWGSHAVWRLWREPGRERSTVLWLCGLALAAQALALPSALALPASTAWWYAAAHCALQQRSMLYVVAVLAAALRRRTMGSGSR